MFNIFKKDNNLNPCCNYLLELSYYQLFVKNFLDKRLTNLTLIKSYSKTIYDNTYHLKCPNCQREFIHIPSREYIGLANSNDFEIIKKWYSTNNELKILNEDNFNKLKHIKSYLVDDQKLFGNKEHWIEIPCKVKLKNGDTVDFCTLFIVETVPKPGHFPLYANDNSKILFLSDIDKIIESEFALDSEIRTKTHFYPDEMIRDAGFYYVKHRNGTIYKVNDIGNFLEINDFKGSDFKNIEKSEIEDLDKVVSVMNNNFKRNYLLASWTFGDNRTLKLLRRKNGSS